VPSACRGRLASQAGVLSGKVSRRAAAERRRIGMHAGGLHARDGGVAEASRRLVGAGANLIRTDGSDQAAANCRVFRMFRLQIVLCIGALQLQHHAFLF